MAKIHNSRRVPIGIKSHINLSLNRTALKYKFIGSKYCGQTLLQGI